MFELHWTFPHSTADNAGVIQTVYWHIRATDGVHTVSAEGEVHLPQPHDGVPSIPFKDVKKEDVIAWVKPLIGYDKYVENFKANLAKLEQVVVLPFDAPPNPDVDSL